MAGSNFRPLSIILLALALWPRPMAAVSKRQTNDPTEYSKAQAKDATDTLIKMSKREMKSISNFAQRFAKTEIDKTCPNLSPEHHYTCFKEQLEKFLESTPVSEMGWVFLISRGVSLIHTSTRSQYPNRGLASTGSATGEKEVRGQTDGLRVQHLQLLDLLLTGMESVNRIRSNIDFESASPAKRIEWVLRQEHILRFLDTSTERMDTLVRSLESIAKDSAAYREAKARYESVRKTLPTDRERREIEDRIKTLEPYLPSLQERQALFIPQDSLIEIEISAILFGEPMAAYLKNSALGAATLQ